MTDMQSPHQMLAHTAWQTFLALHPELDDTDSRRNGLEEYLQQQIDSGVTEKAELLVIALKRLRDRFSESDERSN